MDINDEELTTAFILAENQMNSRPLMYQTREVGDLSPISPNDFLVGRVEDDYIETAENTTLLEESSGTLQSFLAKMACQMASSDSISAKMAKKLTKYSRGRCSVDRRRAAPQKLLATGKNIHYLSWQ